MNCSLDNLAEMRAEGLWASICTGVLFIPEERCFRCTYCTLPTFPVLNRIVCSCVCYIPRCRKKRNECRCDHKDMPLGQRGFFPTREDYLNITRILADTPDDLEGIHRDYARIFAEDLEASRKTQVPGKRARG